MHAGIVRLHWIFGLRHGHRPRVHRQPCMCMHASGPARGLVGGRAGGWAAGLAGGRVGGRAAVQLWQPQVPKIATSVLIVVNTCVHMHARTVAPRSLARSHTRTIGQVACRALNHIGHNYMGHASAGAFRSRSRSFQFIAASTSSTLRACALAYLPACMRCIPAGRCMHACMCACVAA